MRGSGRSRTALAAATGVVAGMIVLAAVVAGPAGAANDPDGYQGDKKSVTVTVDDPPPSFDGTNTTFTFKLNATENVSHVLLMACPDIQIVSATGPQGAAKEGDAPKEDPSIEGGSHVGIKFAPGVPGTYTLVLAGNISGAEFVVKDGTGHMHFIAGTNPCQPVTSQQPPPTPSGEQPSQQQQPPGQNPSNPGGQGASNQPGQSGTQVAGATETKPGSDVLGNQLTAPEAQANLPRTGLPVPALASIGTMLLALGGVATALGRRPRG